MPLRVLPSHSSSFRIIILNDKSDYVTSLLRLSNDLPLKMLNSWLWPIKPYRIQILLNSQSSFCISQLNCWDTAILAVFLPCEQVKLVSFSGFLHLIFILFRTIFSIPLSSPSPPIPPRFLHGCLCLIIQDEMHTEWMLEELDLDPVCGSHVLLASASPVRCCASPL